MGMFGQLIKIVARIIVALDYCGTIRSETYIPADITDLGHY